MVVMIVQARMGSTRLPGKVLRPILGRPMLSYQIERLRRVNLCQQVVVATTTQAGDDQIFEFCRGEGIDCARGSELDVLSRYCDAALPYGATTIVRVTSDCPLIDPALIDLAISTYLGPENPDYVSNMLELSWPYGMAVEVMSAQALFAANRESNQPYEREHVTPFIYRRPDRFRLLSLKRTPSLAHHRWTVDTTEDFELVRRILEAIYPNNVEFTMSDVLSLLERHPDWVLINAHVKQNTHDSQDIKDGV